MKNYWAKLRKRTKVEIIIGCILLIFGAFFGAKLYIERPRDLGPELEYVGKSTYGCYVPYFCWTRPGVVYYFATDMTEEDLKEYFKKAAYVDNYEAGGGGSYYTLKTFYFSTIGANEEFFIHYQDNTQAVIDSFDLEQKQITKKHIISIGGSQYMRARAALE